MRLGSNEALIFTSGRPAIRATKLRYYADPSFKRLAQIAPLLKSDRIAHPPTVAGGKEQPKDGTQNGIPAQMTSDQVATGRVRRHKPAPAEQLSFLKFAVENGKGAVEAPKEEGAKERLL
jgi:type IV secretory pathway TraG/TraD family ATPase VirD4